MREDQIKQLDELAEDLMDVFMSEADPRNWNGAGQSAADMTPETRGARNWDVKNANQVGALLARVLDLRQRVTGGDGKGGPPPPADVAERDIKRFEGMARDALQKAGIPVAGRA